MGTFTFVYIPQDRSQAVQERRLTFSPGKDIECLLDEIRNRLQAGLAKRSTARTSYGAYVNAPTSNGSFTSGLNCPIKTVRCITLLHNSRANDYIGVNMYVDGSAAKNGAPENARAEELCQLCGNNQLQVHGDAWVARVYDDDDNFERLDFHTADLAPSSPWVAVAAQQRIGGLRAPAQTILARIRAYCAEKEAAKRDGLHAAEQPAPQKRARTAAEAAQEEADAAFKAHNHAAAAELFGKCAAAAGPDEEALRLAALGKRALAYLKLRQPAVALADCNAVLAAQPGHPAALYRKAAACRALGRREDARALLRRCVELQPGNQVARVALGKLERVPAH